MSLSKPPKVAPARIHLLAAKEAPIVIVLRRKPSKRVHVMRWNTETDDIENGSWFTGRIYEMRADVSFDGNHLIYLAMGATGDTWTGVCEPPFLKTVVDWPNVGAWHGGGVFTSSDRLELNAGHAESEAFAAVRKLGGSLPFQFGKLANPGYGEDEGVLYPRLERDGFERAGEMPKERKVKGKSFAYVCENDPGWVIRPTSAHPVLRLRYRGYSSGRGRIFEWDLPEYPGLLDKKVSWVTYDCLGQLIVARNGVLLKYNLGDIASGEPTKVFDLEGLEPPKREDREGQEEPLQ